MDALSPALGGRQGVLEAEPRALEQLAVGDVLLDHVQVMMGPRDEQPVLLLGDGDQTSDRLMQRRSPASRRAGGVRHRARGACQGALDDLLAELLGTVVLHERPPQQRRGLFTQPSKSK